MTLTKLTTRRIEKVWGRRDLGPWFADVAPDAEPVGEIWYEMPGVPADAPELLVKVLFTSERLSIQVHPDDAGARAAGYPRGKEEAWLVLDAQPGAHIGLGTIKPLTGDALRAAALDGSIEALMDWKPVAAGDVFYSAAGTVHAIGPGLAVVEVQQNVDLTYRLYDYGRPRELHLDAGVAASDARPWTDPCPRRRLGDREILADGRAFVLERWRGARDGRIRPGRPVWLTILAGEVTGDGAPLAPGEVWYGEAAASLTASADADLLVAYPGGAVAADLWISRA